ncbi:MAG: ATP synthase F1 subunit epsilon [Opitutales bacterium]|nr:ATP synthase F1 subunit epsilon [Opitutales bacterium]
MQLIVKVITPNGVDVDVKADSVSVSTELGEIEILPGHRPLISILSPGCMVLKEKDKIASYIIDQGFVRVVNDTVLIITDEMLSTKDVDARAIDAAVKRATQALEDARNNRSALDPMEIERLEAKVKYHMAQKLLLDK